MAADESKRAVRISTILTLMYNQNISRSELAKRTKITLKQINNILDGRNQPREVNLTRIASILGVKAHTLLLSYTGKPESIGTDNVLDVTTTTAIIVHMKDDISPEQGKELLFRRLTEKQVKDSNTIIFTIIRDTNGNKN